VTAAILAAAMLVVVLLFFALRADLHRYAIARVMELRPAKPARDADAPRPAEQALEDAPLVAPPLELPDLPGVPYGRLKLLDATPVEREAAAAAATEAADHDGLVAMLRDPKWERKLARTSAVPRQWDTELKRLDQAWEAAIASLREKDAAARERLGVASA
jgi:hypothetical protein